MILLVYALTYIFPAQMSINYQHFFREITGISSNIADYWYISVVLTSTLIFYPLLLWGYKKSKIAHYSIFLALLLINLLILIAPYLVDSLNWKIMESAKILNRQTLANQVTLIMPFFMLGYALSYAFLDKTTKFESILYFSTALAFCFHSYNSKWAFAIILCILFVNSKYISTTFIGKSLAYLGSYSACMWLNHRLIFGYWHVDFFYNIPTPLNLIIIVILSLILSVLITKSYHKFTKLFVNSNV